MQASEPLWDKMPTWPPDVFAVVATLIDRSSAYRHVIEPPTEEGVPVDRIGILDKDVQQKIARVAECWAWTLMEAPDPETIRKLESSDPAWSEALQILDFSLLNNAWSQLVGTYANEMIICTSSEETQDWWKPATLLMIAADIASRGIGFHTPPFIRDGLPTKVQFQFLLNIKKRFESAPSNGELIDRGIVTLTTDLIDQSISAVLPKTRTSPLGCTLRSMTHNLALVPPSGQVEARWHVSGSRPYAATASEISNDIHKPLNLLLIPFPYKVNPSSFKVKSEPSHELGDWGYFHLSQDWLTPSGRGDRVSQLVAFVRNLVNLAADELGEVHGVIFPEFSLDAETYLAIAEALKETSKKTGFEFIIAGTSEEPIVGKPHSKPGNYAVFSGLKRPGESSPPQWGIRGCREKHHRWKINKPQILRYGLGSRLKPSANWWEGIPVSRRILDFFEVRAGTSLTVLICEDLARSDPCQAVVRAVGPNLVIALLMDGPQLPARWPGHYAGVLADDPGSSILTLTSMGLIERAAVTDAAHSRSIALFRDHRGDQRTLQLPQNCHALAVRLSASKKEEHTLDGRGDGNSAYLWSLDEVVSIRADQDSARPWIVGS